MFRKLILMVLLSTLVACPCPDAVEKERILLNESDRSFFFYQQDDTITFVHSNGLQFDFSVEEISEGLQQSFLKVCGGSFSSYETLNYSLSSLNPFLSIKISVVASGYYNNTELEINKNSFAFDRLSEPEHDSIELVGGIFKKVYELENISSNEIQIERIFLNSEKGILQINISNGEIFFLRN